MRRIASVSLGIALVTVLAVTPGGAVSATSSSPDGLLHSLAVDEEMPGWGRPLTAEDMTNWSQRQLDIDTNIAITDLVTADDHRAINTVTWDPDRDVVSFYVFGDTRGLEARIAEALGSEQRWEIIAAQRPIAELEKVIESLAADSNALPSGARFVSGTPAPDGSSITVGVEVKDRALRRSLPPPDAISGVPVTYEKAARPEVATRLRNSEPIISGGYTQGPPGSCSSGYPVVRNQDNQPNMLTADHCTSATKESWQWGTGSVTIGSSTFQAAGDTDLELFTNSGPLSAWMFAGSYTDNTTVAPIRGYLAPVGGNSVCYNGSRSGPVCSNVLENSDAFSCVAFLQCYWTRWSTQSSGIPAAGNGDSGGPVAIFALRSSDNTVGAYGVGVISMMSNTSSNCTGDPSTSARECSANMGMAPLSRWANAQYTHSLVYTTS